jgi:hypothetical protein
MPSYLAECAAAGISMIPAPVLSIHNTASKTHRVEIGLRPGRPSGMCSSGKDSGCAPTARLSAESSDIYSRSTPPGNFEIGSSDYELVYADWRPRNHPATEWQSIGVSVMGPMRPGLQFMRCAKQKQLELLRENSDKFDIGYPFKWPDLLAPVVNSCFDAHRPRGLCKEGAPSWFSLAGGPEWHGGI